MRAMIWMLLSVPVVVIAYQLYLQLQKNKKSDAQQALHQTLTVSNQLLKLIDLLQQYRGLSSAWLSGESSFADRLKPLELKIEAAFQGLLQSARQDTDGHFSWMNTHDLMLLNHRWKSLVDALPTLNAEQCIEQHSNLLTKALAWLSATGDMRIEPLGGGSVAVGVVKNFSHRLPLLAETLGQARALGGSVAATGGCSSVLRVRLLFLMSRAEALLEQAQAAQGGAAVSRRCQLAIREMATTIRTRMLFGSGVEVSPPAFFTLSTRAIDTVFEWVRVCEHEIHRLAETEPVVQLSAC